ncbi:MAG: BamA/TamA family outer membrane protein [Bacteroidales bacterium]|nr:BamA/TamA family outer membrane protein [Bacteroidales bacterium]MDT8432965.1 BamA/TamA family outer membrane protein [Bacteroidales bacterium]
MIKQRFTYRYLLVPALLLVTACSGLKHLPEDEKLYTGAKTVIESDEPVDSRELEKAVKRSVRPDPNSRILGMRPKLWLYMAAGEDPATGIGRWLKKQGEPPVFLSEVRPAATAEIIDATLFNRGIFNSYTEPETVEGERTAKVVYHSFVHAPYSFGALTYEIADDSLLRLILRDSLRSLIQPGDPYRLDVLKSERMRIDALMKNKGYYFFSVDDLLFRADTSAENRTVALQLSLNEGVSEQALTQYRINRVVIDQGYSLSAGSGGARDTLHQEGYLFPVGEAEAAIRPEVILGSVFLRPGEIYSRKKHSITLNRLMSMGTFKFVQVRFTEADSAAGLLDVEILLTTMTKRNLRAEMDLVSKSNNFAGPRMNVSLQNRNAFGGAEQLNLSMAGSFESQLGGKERNLFSYSVNPQVELIFPRFVAPIQVERPNSVYIPKTRLSFSYNFLKRVNYFNMNTFQFLYGYRWKERLRIDHELNPVSISYTALGNRSDAFNELLESNPVLRTSYQEMFIAGSYYSYTYNEQLGRPKRMQYYLNATAETAGNLFSLATVATGGEVSDSDPATVFGAVYSQFAKVSVDGRGYLSIGEQDKLAMRLFAGYAKAYGNASVLPYSRQFFSGGPNSIRAFLINSVGPGTYLQDQEEIGYFHLGGDVKLELNAEYRFTIYNMFKGAVFADVGNVWLQRSNPAEGNDYFALPRILNELAVGAGAGLRLDVSFFILRFDVAVPLRKPWLAEGSRWVSQEPGFMEDGWLWENAVLNVAIGYPF